VAGIENGNYTYQLINILGKCVRSGSFEVADNSIYDQIRYPENLASGIYYIKLTIGDKKVLIRPVEIIK